MPKTIILTEEEKERLITLTSMFNEREVMRRMNISRAILQKYKYQLGLVKSKKGSIRYPATLKDDGMFHVSKHKCWIV